jgi:hypothetical protein
MSLTIHPDPGEPAGGFAFLRLPAGALSDAAARVAVRESFGGRWLARSEAEGERIGIGNADWQSERFDFGPYEVLRREDGDWLRIGPEIVNKIEEYTALRFLLGDQAHDVTWPDDVPPRAGVAVIGALLPVARQLPALNPEAPVGRPEAAAGDPGVPPEETAAESANDPPAERAVLIPVLLVLLLLAALFGAWYYWGRAGNPVAPPPGDGARCSYGALSAVPGGFAAIDTAIRACGRNVTPDTALRLIEAGVAGGDAAALLLLGTLYDGANLDPVIENLIGLGFDDNPARAAEYYARARQAGATRAPARLRSVCARLPALNTTLARGAYDDYCG